MNEPDRATTETVILCLSDTHIGTVVKNPNNRFNLRIAENRLTALAEEVTASPTDSEECYLFFNGDYILGQLRPSAKEIAECDVLEQQEKAAGLFAGFIKRLSERFQSIRCFGTLGNHGRLNRPGQDGHRINHDMTVLRMTNLLLGEGNPARIALPENEFQAVNIHGFHVTATHGDQIRSNLGLPAYGLTRLLNNTYSASNGKLDLLLVSHFHRFTVFEDNNRTAVINGSLIGPDDYANKFGMSNQASQVMLTIKPKTGITSIRNVPLGHIQR